MLTNNTEESYPSSIVDDDDLLGEDANSDNLANEEDQEQTFSADDNSTARTPSDLPWFTGDPFNVPQIALEEVGKSAAIGGRPQ